MQQNSLPYVLQKDIELFSKSVEVGSDLALMKEISTVTPFFLIYKR